MARELEDSFNVIITKRVDAEGSDVYQVKAEGSACDPDAANEFDKGPVSLTASISYDGSTTLDNLMTVDVINALKAAAGIS